MNQKTMEHLNTNVAQTKVVLAFNNILLREGISKILNEEGNIIVVAEASNILDLIRSCEECIFDIMLLDVDLQGLNIQKILRLLKNKNGGKVILIIGSKYDENEIINAIHWGVRGYLLKDTNSKQLKKAIEAVSEGQLWIERKMMGKALDTFLNNHNFKIRTGTNSVYNLTRAELKVTKMVLNGYSNLKIASEMYLSEKTVKFHLYKIFKKLSLSNRSELILYGFRNGIII